MRDLKVALISHEFPPYSWGGVSSNCQDLALALSEKGVNTTVFSGRANTITSERINEYLSIVRLPCLDFPPRPIWFQLQNLKSFSRLLRECDVIHGVNPLSSTIALFIGKKLKKPVLTSIHEVFSKDLATFVSSPIRDRAIGDLSLHVLEYPLYESLVRASLNASDHVIVCGSSAREDMLRIYKHLDFQKISVIHNGINFDKIDFRQTPVRSLSNSPNIVFFGRLIWRKGILHLLRSMQYVKKEFPNAMLHVFGKGFLEKKIFNLSKELAVSQNIVVHGHVSYQELIDSIKRATLVVLPSLYEVGPFVSALEAMALRKPLIAFDLPFAREFISNMHTGILAESGNTRDLASKICIALSDNRLCQEIGESAYDYVRAHHDWKSLSSKYLEVYDSLSKQ